MASRDGIIDFCDELLDVGSFTDYGPNGLQVPGEREVRKIVTGVSAHRALIGAAHDRGAQMLLTHHGLFWEFHSRALSEQMAERLRIALGANLSVAGYHLPLDAHREIGNNAILCDRLGLEPTGEEFGAVKGRPVGVIGRCEGIPITELTERVAGLTGQPPLVQGAGPADVRSAAFVTGAGAGTIHEAVSLGLDCLVTGEPAEHAMADAEEGGIHFVAAGHYATETFGIRRLGELVAERFGVEHEFCDFPNPV